MSDAGFLAAIEGFIVCASIIVAIGPQNAFVLRQGLQRSHVFAVATVCALCDIVLIAAGVAGLGALVQQSPALLNWITAIGVAFLFTYGVISFRRAWRGESLRVGDGGGVGLTPAILTSLALTLLNPHPYLDNIIVIGGLSARYPTPEAIAFGIGAAVASTLWFYGLAYGARLLVPIFARPVAWRVLDVLVGLLVWGIAASLAGETLFR